MLIDIHAHIGGPAERASTAEAVREYQRRCAVDTLLVSNLDAAALPENALDQDEADANFACAQACRLESGWHGLFWVRPGRFDSHPRVLSGALGRDDFVGAIFAPGLNDFPLQAALLESYLATLASQRAPAFFLNLPDERSTVANLAALTRRFCNVKFVLLDPASAKLRGELAEFVRKTASAVFLELPQSNPHELQTVVRTVGAGRLVFGSRAGRDVESASRAANSFRELEHALSPEDFEAISWKNAHAILRLPTAVH